MSRVPLYALLFGVLSGVVACGPDHPPPSHRAKAGPGAAPAVPPPTPSIHFTLSDANGSALDLRVECGETADIKQCAEVGRTLLDRIAKVRGHGPGEPTPGR